MTATQDRILTLLARIDAALLAEIEIVREGRFQELRDIQKETEAAMRGLDGLRGELSAPDVDKPRLTAAIGAVSARAEQAKSLIGAALNGTRDARRRLEGAIRADGRIGAYDRTGGAITMKPGGSPYNKTI